MAKTVKLTRTFKTSPQKVWDMWTNPELMAKWWSPDHFSVPVCELDVRAGGSLRIDMQGPDGTVYPSTGEYKVVDEPRKLSFENSPLDADGNKLFVILESVELSETGGETTMVVTSEVLSETPEAAPYIAGMEPGLNQALGKFERELQ